MATLDTQTNMPPESERVTGAQANAAATESGVDPHAPEAYESEHEQYEPEPYGEDDEMLHPYRALSRGAVISFAIAILSLLVVFFSPVTVLLPLFGFIIGLVSARRIKRYPSELSGRGMALAGCIGSLVLLISGAAFHTVIYVTEVPEGYERISFQMLQPEAGTGTYVPESALALNGKRVFVKGYIHPSVGGLGMVRQFVLVPDLGTCCFGGQPKLTDMIEVTLPEHLGVQYSRRKQKLAGTLIVDTKLKRVDGLTGVFYQLKADMVR